MRRLSTCSMSIGMAWSITTTSKALSTISSVTFPWSTRNSSEAYGDDTLYDGPGNEWMQGDAGNDTYKFDPSNDLTGVPRSDYVVENSDPAIDDDTLDFTGYVEPVSTGSIANQVVAGNLTVTIANGATIADVVGPSVGTILPADTGQLVDLGGLGFSVAPVVG